MTTPLAQNGEYDFSTVSGDLDLLVPQETRMTVTMKTVSGDLSCALARDEGWRQAKPEPHRQWWRRAGAHQERQRRLHHPRRERQPRADHDNGVPDHTLTPPTPPPANTTNTTRMANASYGTGTSKRERCTRRVRE